MPKTGHPDPVFPRDWAQLYAFYGGRLRSLLDSVLLHELDHVTARDLWYQIESEHEQLQRKLLGEAGAAVYDLHRRG